MRKLPILLTLIITVLFFACQQSATDTTDPDSENINAINELIADSADVIYDALDDENEENMLIDDPNWLYGSEASLSKTSCDKDSVFIRFARVRKHVQERNVQVVMDTDTTATAYVHIKFTGILIVRKAEFKNDTLTYDRFEKPIVHEVDLIVKLKKFRNTEIARRNWKIVEISMREGESADPGVDIVELVIKPAGMDSVVVTDPLSFFQNRENLFTYPRMTEITLSVKVKNTTANPVVFPKSTSATETVLLHYGRGIKNGRLQFARSWFHWVGQDNEGNNIYQGTWIVRQFFGLHHAVIDVIDNGTIHEKDAGQYPYVSNTWASPYRVTPYL